MKPTILLLLLISVFVQAIFASTNNTDEKFDLTPKIKKGDSWKMVMDVGGLKKYNPFEQDQPEGKLIWNNHYFYGSPFKFEWDVHCKESNQEKIILQFKLTRLITESTSNSHDFKHLTYNDTDYPLTLDDESKNIIEETLKKSIVLEIPWAKDSTIKTLINDFEKDEKHFPTFTFQNKNQNSNRITKFSANFHNAVAKSSLRHLLIQWKNTIPSRDIQIGDNWNSYITVAGNTPEGIDVEINYTLTAETKNSFIIKAKYKNHENEILFNKYNNWPEILDNKSIVRTYSYAWNNPNTHIKGKFLNNKSDGLARLEVIYPIKNIKKEILVKNGQFELNFDLKEPVFAIFNFEEYRQSMFLTPRMDISLICSEDKLITSGFGASDVNCVQEFNSKSFNWIYNTNEFPNEKIKNKTNELINFTDSLLSVYKDSISTSCYNYIKTESKFQIASWYLSILERINIERSKQYAVRVIPLNLNQLDENENYVREFIDTMQINGNYSLCSSTYHEFIKEYLAHEQSTFLRKKGRTYSRNAFNENILFAGMQYIGYPYYYAVYNIIEREIQKGNSLLVDEELNNFSEFPCNSNLYNKLKQEKLEMDFIKPGIQFPLSEIRDFEGSIHKLPKNEFCIVHIGEYYGSHLGQIEEKKEVSRFLKTEKRIDKINFIVIRPSYVKGAVKETSSNDTINFKYIYISEKENDFFSKFKLFQQRRTIVLDDHFKILDNNVGDIRKNNAHHFPNVIQKYFETQNQPKSHEGRRAMILGALITLLGTTLIAWLIIKINSRRIKKREAARRKLSELELKAIRSQMNPHFIFNAMGSIQNLINQNNTKNANLYLSSFAKLMRMVLANSNKKLVSLADELELLKNYLELEQLRVDFKFDISTSENIDPETEEIPGMLVQPFVENAVIHGITPKGKGNIKVRFSKKEEVLVCEIIDDGVGINTSGAGNGNGVAMKLAEKRLNLLNSQLQTKLSLTVENRMDSEKTAGTKITLLIPVG